MADACRPGNPKDPAIEDVKALYLKLLQYLRTLLEYICL
jgi:hypothetical protein